MPDPKKYKPSEKSKYMRDCMHQVVHVEHKDRDQGIAQCLNVWRQHHKKSARIVLNKFLSAGVKEDLAKAEDQDKSIVFLGGLCKDNLWRSNIIQEFKDQFSFIDPYDPDWDPAVNIYEELMGLMKSDYVIFYKGGKGSRNEKDFLDGVEKDYREFDDIDVLKGYLKGLNKVQKKASTGPTINWTKPNFAHEADEYFGNRYTTTYLAGLGINLPSKKDLYGFLTKGSFKEMTKDQLVNSGHENFTMDPLEFESALTVPEYAESYRSMESALQENGSINLEAPILIKANGKYFKFSGNRRTNLAFSNNLPVKFWVVYAHYAKTADYVATYIAKTEEKFSPVVDAPLEIPTKMAVESTIGEHPTSSGFHEGFKPELNGLNPCWAIIYDGKVSDTLVRAAKESGLRVSLRYIESTDEVITDLYLDDVKQSDTDKAQGIFDNFAEIYQNLSEKIHRVTAKHNPQKPLTSINS